MTEHWDAIRDARLSIADTLEALTPEQWASPSLCAGWSVRDMAAHLVVPHVLNPAKAAATIARKLGSFADANTVWTRHEAKRPTADLVADIRRFATSHKTPPTMSSVAPLTDMLVHSLDIRLPLGLPDPQPVDPWVHSLAFLQTWEAKFGFLAHPLPRVRWIAKDLDWSSGTGPEVRAPARALGLAMLGRTALLDDLDGPAAFTVSAWVRSHQG